MFRLSYFNSETNDFAFVFHFKIAKSQIQKIHLYFFWNKDVEHNFLPQITHY